MNRKLAIFGACLALLAVRESKASIVIESAWVTASAGVSSGYPLDYLNSTDTGNTSASAALSMQRNIGGSKSVAVSSSANLQWVAAAQGGGINYSSATTFDSSGLLGSSSANLYVRFRVLGNSEVVRVVDSGSSITYSSGGNSTTSSDFAYVRWKFFSVENGIGAWISPSTGYSYSPGEYVMLVESSYFSRQGNDYFCRYYNPCASARENNVVHLDFGGAVLAPGSSSVAPIVPVGSSAGRHTLVGTAHVGDAVWYDPELASGYDFETSDGSGFTAITGLPEGFQQPFDILVNGSVVAQVSGGGTYSFTQALGHSVSKFGIRNIVPGVDPNSPTAFPIGLTFDRASPTFTMTATEITAVPEAQSSWYFMLGLACLGGVLARRRRAAGA